MDDLAGKHAVVTGASSGIGKAIALLLAKQDVNLTLCGRNEDTLTAIADEACSAGVTVRTECADLSDPKQLNALATTLRADSEPVHILIHSAGVIRMGAVADLSPKDVGIQLQVNTLAPYTLTHALLPKLRAKQGDIVFINSRAGYMTFQNNSGYCMSKFALTALADVLREELREDGVRVSSVFPGKVATAMQAALHQEVSKPYRPESYVDVAAIAQSIIDALRLPANTMLSSVVIEPVKKT